MSNILIVDDHSIVREGMKLLVAKNERINEIDEAASGEEALSRLKENSFSLAIVDISLPDKDGMELVEYIVREFPSTKVLVLTMHNESIYAKRVLQVGAVGFISKDSANKELIKAINKILDGGRYVSEELADILLFDSNPDKLLHEVLSKRELQVFRMIVQGDTAKLIASKLNLSVKTVNTYRSRILEKTNLNSTAEIITYGIKNNLA